MISNYENIGIDLQEINELPDSIDFWEDEFYFSKFTPKEIAYCLAKDNPKQTFAGLYCCKEALIKSNNKLAWDQININFSDEGRPLFDGYLLSISHSGEYSIAIAININKQNQLSTISNNSELNNSDSRDIKNSSSINLSIIYAIILLIIAYIILKDFLLII
jgi:phosphopantetheine--protein transferase-like protein